MGVGVVLFHQTQTDKIASGWDIEYMCRGWLGCRVEISLRRIVNLRGMELFIQLNINEI